MVSGTLRAGALLIRTLVEQFNVFGLGDTRNNLVRVGAFSMFIIMHVFRIPGDCIMDGTQSARGVKGFMGATGNS